MKKVLALILVIVISLSCFSCTEYKPVKSTKEEQQVIMTLSIEGEEYQVRYELYRALFLAYKSTVDGGDATVWGGENKNEYIDQINAIIADVAADIFAAIHVCETVVGFDLYSNKADKLVEELVTESVEGGDDTYGHGTYEAYLDYLKSQNLNYSVHDLFFRYYIALEKIDEHFVGDTESDTMSEDDAVLPKDESSLQAVREFYYSDDFARVFYVTFSLTVKKDLTALREKMLSAAKDGKSAVLNAVKSESIWDEIFLAKHAYNSDFENLSEKIFALPAAQVSEIIKIDTTGDPTLDGYYILYSIEKSESDFTENYSDVKEAYITEKLGIKLTEVKNTLKGAVNYTPVYEALVHSEIKM